MVTQLKLLSSNPAFRFSTLERDIATGAWRGSWSTRLLSSAHEECRIQACLSTHYVGRAVYRYAIMFMKNKICIDR